MTDKPIGLYGPGQPQDPNPDPANASGSAGGNPKQVRSEQDCLVALDQLVGLVAIGLISPSKANAMRGILQQMLAHHRGVSGGATQAAPISRELWERLRSEPELMNSLAPLFTPDQIAALMRNASDGNS